MNWQERAEKAESELAKLAKQKPALYMAFSDCGNFIRYWTRDTKNLEATMAVNDFEVLEFYARPVPAPAVPAANPVQWLADEGDMILVPRGLLGAACSSIDKQRPAPKVLEALRYYTMNAPQAPAVPEDWRKAIQEAHDTFQRYADLHQAKGTHDGYEKAKANQKLANKLYALLQSAEVAK